MKHFLILFCLLPMLSFPQSKNSDSIIRLENLIRQDQFKLEDNAISVSNNIENSKKSVGLGIIYSLLLPGMGELYAGAYDIGKYFTIAEGVLWGTYIGMNTYASWKQDNYKSFASQRAGVDNNNKNSEYYGVISDYSDIDSYNDEKALNRDFEAMYNKDQYFWKWQSTEDRKTYRAMWTSSEQTYNDLRFIVGAMILNRVASAVNAARLVASYNNKIEDELGWNVSVGLTNYNNLPTSITLNFTGNF